MPPLPDLLVFALAALVLVLTPGPNMIYLISRSICQGPRAGLVSLAGVGAGFVVHMLAAALGVSAVFLAAPVAYDALRVGGALYLLWLAWDAVRSGGGSPFAPRALPPAGTRRLLAAGLLTSILNPKVALFYIALLPQFVDPGRGQVLIQSLILGTVQITISLTVNALFTLSAGRVARWFARHPLWLALQRWVMGVTLAALAVRLVMEERRSP